MKLIKITKSGALHFRLSDGRLGVSYESGYVRVSVKGINNRLYQINKLVKVTTPDYYKGVMGTNYFYKRDIICKCVDRVQHLLNFNNNNCI
jgi:hypothetical protein